MMEHKKVFQAAFSDDRFWTKLKAQARAAGREVIEKALWLYYAAQAPGTPVWAKTTIYGALGYFIFPFDAIPDLVPALGYTDDLGMLAAALATVAMYISADVKERAARKLSAWFGT